MHTCAISVPATSSTGTTLSGLCGLATSGPSSPRSISTRSSYSAPSSGPTSTKSSSRSWRFSHSLVRLVGREHGGGGAELGDHVGDRRPLGDAEIGGPRPGELEHLVLAAAGAQAAEQLEDDVLGLHPGPAQLSLEVNLDHLGAGDLVRVAAEHHGDVEAAGADGDHAHAARLHGVGVGAEHRLARLAEALHVDVVADPVARPREVQPVLARQRLEHAVVVGVLVVELDDVVVDVLHRPLHLDPRRPRAPRTASAPWCRSRPGAGPDPSGSRSAGPA